MMQVLEGLKHQKITRLQSLLQETNPPSVLAFEEQWWAEFLPSLVAQIEEAPSDLISKTLNLQEKVTHVLASINNRLVISSETSLIAQQQTFSQPESEEQRWENESIDESKEEKNSREKVETDRENNAWSEELDRVRVSLEQSEKQNTELMKRLVKSLQRCSALIEKVDKLKQQNIHLQAQDSNSMKYYQRLLAENKKELKQKDEMIRLYEIKLQVYRGQQSPRSKLTDRGQTRGYLYTSQGILDRIQSLRILAKGKIKGKSNATQIEEIS